MQWSVRSVAFGTWASSRSGYLALCFKRGCETNLNVMVPGWSQIVFGCVWLCHCYLNLCCLRSEINEFLGPGISHNLACFQLWDVVGHFDFSASWEELKVERFGLCSYLELRYCKICHPEKSQKDQLQEQFATALMIQYCFSELEWGSLAKLGCPACFIFHPKHHCCTSSVYQGDAVWVSIGGQVWCQQRAVVLAAGCWIVWPLQGSTSTWKKLCITNFFGLDFLMWEGDNGDYFSKSLSSMANPNPTLCGWWNYRHCWHVWPLPGSTSTWKKLLFIII